MTTIRSEHRTYLPIIAGWGALLPLTWLLREWHGCVNGISRVSASPPEWDFTIFWEAGHLALAGHFSAIANFQQFHQMIFSALHYDVGLSPFAYSPVSYLVFAPLALLPLPIAYIIWVVSGVAVLLISLRLAGLTWWFCGFVLASPAFLYNLLLGQNGAFIAALLISAVSLTGRRNLLAGVSGACLFIKPQLALLVPFMWLSRRHALAIGAAMIAVISLVILSVAIFGVLPWELFFTRILPMMTDVMSAPFPQGYQVSAITLFMLLRAVGCSALVAQALQVVAIFAAAMTVMLIWQRCGTVEKRFGLTIMLALLAMPYGYVYDMIAYAAVLALVGQSRGASVPLAIFWLWPAVARNVTLAVGLPLTPVILLAAIIWLARLPARPALVA